MRIGEVFALKWGDIDFKGLFITVKRSYSSGKFLTSPKSGHLRRVDMTMQLTETLWKYKRSKPVFGENIPDWVFSDSKGNIQKEDSFREYVFYRRLKLRKRTSLMCAKSLLFFMVEGDGFEPSKAELADLQSAPFDHSGTPPQGLLI